MRTLRPLVFGVCLAACSNTTTFYSNPGGARVWVNGELCGETPCKYYTRYGFPSRIRVQAEKDGYQPTEFFLDSEPPLASYLLFVVGSYLFHTYDEEYRFNLEKQAPAAPSATPPAAAPAAGTPTAAAPPQ